MAAPHLEVLRMGNSETRHSPDPDHGSRDLRAEPDAAPTWVDGEAKAVVSSVAGDAAADDELLGAVTASLSEAVHIDHTLDVLTSSIDLFEVPAWDSDASG